MIVEQLILARNHKNTENFNCEGDLMGLESLSRRVILYSSIAISELKASEKKNS